MKNIIEKYQINDLEKKHKEKKKKIIVFFLSKN